MHVCIFVSLYVYIQEKGSAKFDKSRKALDVTLLVLSPPPIPTPSPLISPLVFEISDRTLTSTEVPKQLDAVIVSVSDPVLLCSDSQELNTFTPTPTTTPTLTTPISTTPTTTFPSINIQQPPFTFTQTDHLVSIVAHVPQVRSGSAVLAFHEKNYGPVVTHTCILSFIQESTRCPYRLILRCVF